MANVPISKIKVPGSEDTLLLRDSTAANKVQSATNGNLAGLNGSGNLIDSGVAASEIPALWKSQGEYGVKNLTKVPYYDSAQTDYHGVTWSYNADGSVTVSANNSDAIVYIRFAQRGQNTGIYLKNGKYKVSNAPNISGISLTVNRTKNDSANTLVTITNGEGEFTVAGDDFSNDGAYVGFFITISKKTTISEPITIYPMIRIADDTDETYRPYAKTNKQLTDKVTENTEDINTLENRADTTTTSASGNPISITGLKSNQLAVNPVITFEPIQAGSGDPSPSNVRAISGYDKIEVLSCGVNVWDEVWELGELNAQGQNASSTTKIRSKNYIPVVGGSTYYLKLSSASIQVYICFYDVNKTFISSNTPHQGTFTVPLMARYCRLGCPATYGTTYNNDMGINYPATQTSYVPYDKTTDLSEPLPQTVYGGSWTVRDGKLVSNLGSIDLGSLTFSKDTSYSQNVFYAYSTSIPIPKNDSASVVANIISEIYTADSANNIDRATTNYTVGVMQYSTGTRVWICDSRYTSATDLQTALSGVKAVYELKTPIEIQLTPHEISLLKDYAYVSTNGTNIALDYHNGEIATLGDVVELSQVVENGFSFLNSKMFKYTDMVVKASTTVTVSVPTAYLLITNATQMAALHIVMGIGYGKEATRHKVVEITSSHSNVTFTPNSDKYALDITNNGIDINVRVYTLV